MKRKMTPATRAELTNAIRGRYRDAVGTAKHRSLEELIAATGYEEKSGIAVLNNFPQSPTGNILNEASGNRVT